MKRIFYLCVLSFVAACSSKKETGPPLFVVRKSAETGLAFTNRLSYSPQFNLFKYMYFYNGSGIGAGDFNNDGKVDLFFGSNQGQNTLYLNDGALKFHDVTKQAGVSADGGWTTGISVVDINNDGFLDIYVCRVGQYETLRSKNQFLINTGVDKTGVPHFVDKASELGVDFSGFSTQAAFFDYDNDEDLDLFLLNHSVHQNNNFRPRAVFEGTFDPLSGDRVYQNNFVPYPASNWHSDVDSSESQHPLGAGKFEDVTRGTGINSTAISYGLGICVADVNLDGYPDLYIGNDFHENDYLYINQKNGTFRDEGTQRLMHTSQYSMGVDVADADNDGLPEIISMDMLPSDPYILKRSLGEDSYDLFHEKIRMGYFYQFTRNNLQYNRGNGAFSEIGLYSGVAATDWSWAPLWMDFDNDGRKDLFISNGIPKRMNDIDYVNFVTSGEVQQKITADDMQGKDLSLIKKFPEIKIPNKFFRNSGAMAFEDEALRIEGDEPTYSNGTVCADFDNDGDLDVVVNNIDEPALLYENKTASAPGDFLSVKFEGPSTNRNAVGAKLLLYSGGEVHTYEHSPVRGFLSSMQTPMHIGLRAVRVDSVLVVWPDRSFQRLAYQKGAAVLTIRYQQGLPPFDFSRLSQRVRAESIPVEDVTAQTGLHYLHRENRFVEFDREPLIPHEVSTESPCVAVGDANGDGLDDVFLGGSRNQKPALFLQTANGQFSPSAQPALEADSTYAHTDACFADVNRDGHLDLIVASGGNEFYGPDEHNTPRIYHNDGRGNFAKLPSPFGQVFVTASCIVPADFDGDGWVDFFIGGRAVPYAYGEVPQSHLFRNNRNGTFTDVTDATAKGLARVGFVTRSIWNDFDRDGDSDLLLSLEWGGLVAFVNNRGAFAKTVLSDKQGWWNFILPCDVNGDGLTDFVAGNLGQNSRLKTSPGQPVRMYYNDFDGNGKKEQVLTYYVGGKEIPFATKAELEKQMPVLKKKFLYAEDLAKASLGEIFGADKLKNAVRYTADYFSNAVLLNKGAGKFETKPLPWQAQLTTYRDAMVVDANADGKSDVLLGGNYSDSNIEMGHYDADYGTLLLNEGAGNFRAVPLNGVAVKGQVRRIAPLRVNKQQVYLLARNNDSARLISFRSPSPNQQHRARLR